VATLVGRDDLLLDLSMALERARAGRGGLTLITGDAGLGKTTLASEMLNVADGFQTIWSWCGASPAGDSLRPWLHVVRALAAADADAARLISTSPWLSGFIGGELPSGDGASETHRWQLFDALADVVRLAARSTPLLIVFDDLHDADSSSLWLLAHLIATLRSCAALVVATARESAYAWHDHTEVRAALQRQSTILRPAPLTEQQIGELLPQTDSLGSRVAVAGRILARTGGNPLLVSELIRSFGMRPADDARALASGVPASVTAITTARLRSCSPLGRRVVEAAAVLGTRFPLDVLAELTSLDLRSARDALREAEAVGLVEFPEPGAGRFIHELVRDAVYESLPPAERSDAHEHVARILSLAAERGRAIAPAEIAYHYLRAGAQSSDLAAQLAQQAGDRAMELLAFEDAAGWYEQALRLLEGTSVVESARRAALALALGEARRGAGDPSGARDQFLQATVLARQCGRVDILARAALGLGSGRAGFEVHLLDRAQLDLLEEAQVGLSEEEPALRALVLARLSVARTGIDSDARRLAQAHEAVELARTSHDDAAYAAALAALCDALAGPEHTAARLAYAGEIVACAERIRDPALELLGRRLRLVALLECGVRPAAESEMTAYRIRAEAFRHPLYTWYVPLWGAMWAHAEGRYEDCRALNDLARAEGASAGSHNAFLLGITQRWCLLADSGQRAELEQVYGSVDFDFDQEGALWARISGALFAAQLGDVASGRRGLDALRPLLASLPRDSEWLACLAQLAQTMALTGPHPMARQVYDALAPFAELFAVEGIGAVIRGPVHWFLALAAGAFGDEPRASEHFAQAAAAAEQLGAPGLVRCIRRDQEMLTPLKAVASAVGSGEHVFRRAGDVWTIRFEQVEVQLRDSKGLQDLAVLLGRPTVQVAALDLAGASTSGDAGEVLDSAARDAYRHRLIELEVEASEADADGDVGRSERIATERDAILEQLTAAYGLGGRARRVGSDAERARTAVTARIRETIRRIRSANPELGQHLARSVRTGTFCVYEPDPPILWQT
jgi:hypothetical protein